MGNNIRQHQMLGHNAERRFVIQFSGHRWGRVQELLVAVREKGRKASRLQRMRFGGAFTRNLATRAPGDQQGWAAWRARRCG